MERLPSHYKFKLSRMQRLMTFIRGWWLGIIIGTPIFLILLAVISSHPIFASVGLLVMLWSFRGCIFGILDLFRTGNRVIEIQEKGIGFGYAGADLWIFTDGVNALIKNRWGTWTIRHHNGTCLDIPIKEMKEDDIALLKDCIAKYEQYHGIGKQKT